MKKMLRFVPLLCGIGLAQNAAVSSYLDPVLSGNADIRIREVRVPATGHTMDTYWCTMGYRTTGATHGYGGIQWTRDNTIGPKNYIYSQWNDYSTNAYNDPKTIVMTFGGEGTGVKSVNNDPQNQWEPGYWHVTADRVWDEGNNTHFAYFVRNGKTGVWRHVMTWSTPEKSLRFTSSYCFIEDWWGLGYYREGHMRKGWNHLSAYKQWKPITTYRYSINTRDIAPGGRSYNKRTNWCGGKSSDASGEYFFMGAGGSVACTNNHNTNFTIPRTETAPQEEYGVIEVSTLDAKFIDNKRKLVVAWSNDSTTVPQFAYTITVSDGEEELLVVTDTVPQKRSDTLDVSSLMPEEKMYTATLDLIDMFDGNAEPQSVAFGKQDVSSVSLGSGNIVLRQLSLSEAGNALLFNHEFSTPVEFRLYTLRGALLYREITTGRVTGVQKRLSEGAYVWQVFHDGEVVSGSLIITQ